jgi:hypothetical protein
MLPSNNHATFVHSGTEFPDRSSSTWIGLAIALEDALSFSLSACGEAWWSRSWLSQHSPSIMVSPVQQIQLRSSGQRPFIIEPTNAAGPLF